MGRPRKELKQPERKKGRLKNVQREAIINTNLCSKIRERLKIPVKELHPNEILKLSRAINTEIGEWLLNNPEGFRLPYGMGYLAISKYVMIPFREDRWEIVNRIKNMTGEGISERFREIVLKKYGKELTQSQANYFIKKGRVKAFFMWFNHRNCSFKKSMVYVFLPQRSLKDELKNQDLNKYYFFNFHDFYDYKIRAYEE